MSTVNIEGIDKTDLLIALHDRAKAQGVGLIINLAGKGQISREDASEYFTYWEKNKESFGGRMRLDYVKGRVVKCDITGPEMETWLYDRDNGEGAAEAVVSRLREDLGKGGSW